VRVYRRLSPSGHHSANTLPLASGKPGLCRARIIEFFVGFAILSVKEVDAQCLIFYAFEALLEQIE
jgi:hypothetical protein